uniref:Smr domain-containing protein n=1 Tax=Oryza meridionalis TaxID=40149 RepID=A0A0E0DKB5_9ORYZ
MAAAAAAKPNLLLPLSVAIPSSRVSLPTGLVCSARSPPPRLRAAASQALTSPVAAEAPEAKQMRVETEAALEWGGVCARLAGFASTAAGRAACGEGRVPVGRSREESERLLEQTAAAALLPAPLDFGGVEDVSTAITAAAGARLLAVREICGVGRSIRAARRVFDQLKTLSEETPDGRSYTPLLDIMQDCDFLTELVQRIEFCLDSTLSVVLDRASDKLATIRKERRKNIDMLESLLRDTSTKIFQGGGIDSPVVTKRRSRMCVGVKASHKHLVPGGIVLSSSGSGATYFMEPRDAISLNNMEVKLSGDERAEELAILGLLTSSIADSKMKIRHLMGKILELDLACARGSYALWINAVRPAFTDSDSDTELNPNSECSVFIEGIQHPLLLEQSLGMVKESTEVGKGQLSDEHLVSPMPIPLDMQVRNDTRIIVISGPNTGGKTATMKTLGLASLMSKAGMFFPAKGTPRLPWFDQVLADIGDHQSLEHSLSTFSGHISRLRKIVQVVSKDSLVLIDEIGSGTDPSEGVALSTSILKYLASRLNLAIVTTHYADLSRLKAVDDRFENAAMEFCLETLQPTYRILWGSTGNSNALSIAKSIGFDQKIRSEADDLDSRVASLRATESEKVQQELKFVKSQMDQIIKNFESQLKNLELEQYNSLMRKAEAATASLAAAHQPTDFTFSDEENESSYVPEIGDKVYVEGLGGGSMASVVETLGEDGSCMVQYGKIKVRVKGNKIKLVQRGTKDTSASSAVKAKGRTPKRSAAEANQDGNVSFGPVVQTSKNTVDLRGMRVAEASHELQMAIDGCRSYQVLFVVHGMGTGAVKECALGILRNHPRVAKFEDESPLNYGCTVAYIE